MTGSPYCPLTPEQTELLERLIATLSSDQRLWVSGYLAGLARQEALQAPTRAPLITVLYGTETGHCQALAEKLCQLLIDRGFRSKTVDMADYDVRQLKQEKFLLVITSTHGEGDPPAPAEGFFDFLHSIKAPRLDGLKFSVLALGDSSYEFFCQAGKVIDGRLEALGGERIQPRQDCDVDYEKPAEEWMAAVTAKLAALLDQQPILSTTQFKTRPAPTSRYDRQYPFAALVFENINLNGRDSEKKTHHLELSIEGSGLSYEPGDAVAVLPSNAPQWVDELLDALGFSPSELVETPKGAIPLSEVLRTGYEIACLTPTFVENYAKLSLDPELKRLSLPENRRELMEFTRGRWVIDLVHQFPVPGLSAQDFLSCLRPMQPRLYSIASSQAAYPDEIHLLVAVVEYQVNEKLRQGTASSYLAERVKVGDRIPIYIEANKHFRLPKDPNTPIIMVGPGTGVAPFRAFLQEREASGARGKNWLFFGERRFRSDFLYQVEWQKWLKNGVLTRMEVAFSRDGPEKIYVQHRMIEQARELYAWLEDGAYFYVCGDASRMAPDVHRALIQVVQQAAKCSREQAEEYIKRLQQEKRYLKDVY
ncbi:MAG: assimilatory sulfite reductase (NADPH) flavoprotein subunit [Methylohalobius sp.]|nr:assimilatory sulfite reductase (NADPH) flavoprotein subunit [Methylohalobius sp.]